MQLAIERRLRAWRIGVDLLVLDQHSRRSAVENCRQQGAGLVAGGQAHHAQAGDAEKNRLQALAVGGTVAAPAARGKPDDERAAWLSIGVVQLGCEVHQGIGGQGGEVSEHQLGHCRHAAQGQTGRHARDG